MSKTWVVARHEFVTTVKRLGFLIATFGIPLFFGGLMFLSSFVTRKSAESQLDRRSNASLVIVDESGLFGGAFPAEKTALGKWTRSDTREEGERRVRERKDVSLILVPADYLQRGELRIVSSVPPSLFARSSSMVPRDFSRWMSEQLAEALPADRLQRAIRPLEVDPVVEHVTVTERGIRRETLLQFVTRTLTGMAFFFITFMAFSASGSYLIQGVADEKENRVLEIVISSVTPSELMFGKLLGLGAAALLQVAIWCVTGVGTALMLVTGLVLQPLAFLFCGLFFLLGYFLYGSLMLSVGSLGTNLRESSQYTMALSLLAISPVFFFTTLTDDPQGTLAHVFSYFPLTASMTMTLRYTVDPAGTPTWGIALVAAELLVSTWLGVKLAARIYRAGLLLYGKRPTPREIWRWLRQAGA